MTATASDLTALRAAALAGDRVAVLLLADCCEEQGDDARAESWRFLADPPQQGWEFRAWEVLRGPPGRDLPCPIAALGLTWFRLSGPAEEWEWEWNFFHGWRCRRRPGGAFRAADVLPEVRDAVLAACRAVLSP